MKNDIESLLVFAIAKELATSDKFAKHLESLVKEHNEDIAENGKSDEDTPFNGGYIEITNEKIHQLISTYAESATALTIVRPILEKNPLSTEALRELTLLLATETNKRFNAVESDGGTRLYYDESFVNVY